MRLNPNKLGCVYTSLSGDEIYTDSVFSFKWDSKKVLPFSYTVPKDTLKEDLIPTGFLYACTS
jgi:hypothetical protein